MNTISVCPTITANDPHDYREQIELVCAFAQRVHIDLMDGLFAPTVSPQLTQVWWPDAVVADIHLMYQNPGNYIDQLIDMKSHMVILHAEATGDLAALGRRLQQAGIEFGLAILADTTIESIGPVLEMADHVLVFSGNLGYHGGSTADLALLAKVGLIKARNPDAEIAWDGGVSLDNAMQLAKGGIQVLNVGGYIHNAAHPADAYAKLKEYVSAHAI